MNPYTDVDFASEWKLLQETRRKPDSSEFWDGRAESFDHKERSPYTGRFIELLGLEDGESVLDMGCGTGVVALELARAGHRAVCADFSPKMLEVLRDKASRLASELGRPLPLEERLVAWDDDWEQAGVAPKSVDVAYASRSMAVTDLGEAVDKLTAAARRRCAATVSTNGSPRCCDAILSAVGRPASSRFDAAFLVDILWQKGFMPEVSYIDYGKTRVFATRSAIVVDAAERLKDASADERARLSDYVSRNARQLPDGQWTVDEFNIVTWAFIAWGAA